MIAAGARRAFSALASALAGLALAAGLAVAPAAGQVAQWSYDVNPSTGNGRATYPGDVKVNTLAGAGSRCVQAAADGTVTATGGSCAGGTSTFTTPLVVNLNAGAAPAPPAGTAAQVVSADGVSSRYLADAAGAGTSFLGRRADGTIAAPTALLTGDAIVGFGAFGYGATAYSTVARAQIFMTAAENWSDTAQGANIQFVTTALGTTNSVVKWTMNTDGSLVSSGGYLKTGVGTVASLPSAATSGAGARMFVTDATACTFGSTVTGGGAVNCPVYSDGANWKAG